MKISRNKIGGGAGANVTLWRVFVLLNLAVVFFGVVFSISLYREILLQNAKLPSNFFTNSVFQTVSSIRQSEFSFARYLGYNSDFSTVNLELSSNDLLQFEQSVITSLNDNTTAYKDLKRKANLIVDGTRLEASVKLKGDRSVHWQNRERRSYKVKLKGESTFNNMREFSLQHAIMRNYIDEWVFHELLKYEDLLYLNYEFINFSVNGGDVQTYVQEQVISNQVVEQSNRREGPIIRLDEDSYLGGDFWNNTTFKVYDETYWLSKNPRLLNHAKAVFGSFHAGELSAAEALDVEKFAKYFAICDVLEAFHGCLPKSIRFYFNPITEKFEPIGFDGHAMRKNYPTLVSDLAAFSLTEGFTQYRGWFKRLFSNPDSPEFDLQREYQRSLARIASSDYIRSFFRSIEVELQRNLSLVQSTSVFGELSSQHPRTGVTPFYVFSQDKVLARAAFINNQLFTNNAIEVRIIGDEIEVRNRGTFALAVADVYGAEPESWLSVDELTSTRTPRLGRPIDEIRIQHGLLGLSELKETAPSFSQVVRLDKSMFIDSDAAAVGLLPSGWMELGDKIVVTSNSTLEHPIRITGKRLVVNAGVTIDFIDEAFIATDSAVSLLGTDVDPVRLTSSDKTGRGLKVVGAGEMSILQYVTFTDLQWLPETKLTNLPFSTTPVLFYESDVKIEHCNFVNFQSEDVVNIFRSSYEINESVFDGGLSDALDTDFSDGSIRNSMFFNMGNDGIDISGSNAIVENVIVRNVGDKAISVGEASTIEVTRSQLLNNNIGIASKDGSRTLISDSSILDNNLGVVVFQKKSQYERASATVWRTNLSSQSLNWVVETSADLFVNGNKISPNAEGVKAELYD